MAGRLHHAARAVLAVVALVMAHLAVSFALGPTAAFGVPCTSSSAYSNVQALGSVTTFSIGSSGDAQVTGTVHWGDGNDTAVSGVGRELEHQWKAPGNYHITFDGSGTLGDEPCSSSDQPLGDVTVLAPLKAKIDYHAGKTSATVDASASTPADQITKYSWTFDDGKTAQGPLVTHQFKKGRHLVSLQILDGHGQQAMANRTIFVGVSPKAERSSDSESRPPDIEDSRGSNTKNGSKSGSKSKSVSGSDSDSDGSNSDGNSSSDGADSSDATGDAAHETENSTRKRGGVSHRRRFCLAANDFAEISTPLLGRGEPVQSLEPSFVTRYENDRKQMQTLAPANLKPTVADAFVATDLLLGGTKPTRAQLLITANADNRLADYCE